LKTPRHDCNLTAKEPPAGSLGGERAGRRWASTQPLGIEGQWGRDKREGRWDSLNSSLRGRGFGRHTGQTPEKAKGDSPESQREQVLKPAPLGEFSIE